jgi:hypothetical protein
MKYALSISAFLLILFAETSGNACQPTPVCHVIVWCMDPENGHEYSKPITDAANGGSGQGIGDNTAACQHKYGTSKSFDWPVNWLVKWDDISGGCRNPDYAFIGKIALGGHTACEP